MLSFAFYFILIFSFFVLLSIALYGTWVTLRALFLWDAQHSRSKNIALKSFIVNAVILVLMILSDRYFPNLYRWILNYLGVISFSFFIALLYWIPQWIFRIVSGSWFSISESNKRLLGFSYIAATAVVVTISVYNFHKPEQLVEFTLQSDKVSSLVRFVHISDIQYGTTTLEEMNEKLERVYQLKPDFIVFTGDLIDFEAYRTEDFSKLAESPVPIFFERGNHEFYHDPTRLLSDLNQVETLRLLLNDKAQYGEVDIVGVDYGRKNGHLAKHLAKLPLDKNRFSILLYHEPVDIEAGVEHGFDLLLYGHTHGGQIWPYTWLVDAMYEYADGFFKVGDSIVYTSDGLSLWGPRMRFGSQNEIVLFTIEPS